MKAEAERTGEGLGAQGEETYSTHLCITGLAPNMVKTSVQIARFCSMSHADHEHLFQSSTSHLYITVIQNEHLNGALFTVANA